VASETGLLASDVGTIAGEKPLRDAADRDFRPAPGTAAVDHGVKVFVPWSLYAVVGEWHFRRNNEDPSVMLDTHWYMGPYAVDRSKYRNNPVFPLKGMNVTADDYVQGALEDWTDGALVLNGEDRYCVITEDEMNGPFEYEVKKRKQPKVTKTVEGDAMGNMNPGSGNFLIEIYFAAGKGHAESVLVSKTDGTGYALGIDDSGNMKLEIYVSGSEACSRTSAIAVNDGRWHHVIAEIDRNAAEGITLYIDGRASNGAFTGAMPSSGQSLSNTGDFLVGRGNSGNYFQGVVDFLRCARGTLADAKTDIDELYAWEFDGPFLRDFNGNPVTGSRRDAGAIELQN
jgi:hypothetical protein